MALKGDESLQLMNEGRKSDRNNMTVSRDLSHVVLRFTMWPGSYKDLQCAPKGFGTGLLAFTSGELIEQLSKTTNSVPSSSHN